MANQWNDEKSSLQVIQSSFQRWGNDSIDKATLEIACVVDRKMDHLKDICEQQQDIIGKLKRDYSNALKQNVKTQRNVS